MNKIEVCVIDDHGNPGGMMMFLAKLTQRGHNIKNMDDLKKLMANSMTPSEKTIERVAQLPHGTIKRFTPITIAIVGASRRFLAQARTNQVGFNYVSASLQYSDYSGEADFVVPYAITEADAMFKNNGFYKNFCRNLYLNSCRESMDTYTQIAQHTDNDTAGYAAPQGLRNILIMQGNHQSWDYFIRTRSCNRNTVETQYVTMLIWEALLNTPDGAAMFSMAGPDCMYGACREGAMCCGSPMRSFAKNARTMDISIPRHIINEKWPLLNGGANADA